MVMLINRGDNGGSEREGTVLGVTPPINACLSTPSSGLCVTALFLGGGKRQLGWESQGASGPWEAGRTSDVMF